MHCHFLLKSCEDFFQCKRFSNFFQQKLAVFVILIFEAFNKMLTNNLIHFEQLAPDFALYVQQSDRLDCLFVQSDLRRFCLLVFLSNIYTPHKLFVGGYTVFNVRPCVRNVRNVLFP